MQTTIRSVLAALLTAGLVALAGCTAPEPVATHSPAVATTPTPTATVQAVAKTQTVVTIGDSVMAAYGVPNGEGWPERLTAGTKSKLVNLACVEAGFASMGVCGSTFADLAQTAVDLHPEVVIIESSVNDSDVLASEAAPATDRTMAALRKGLPKATIIALSTVYDESSEWPKGVLMTSEWLQHAAAANGAVYIDIGKPLEGHRDWLQDDDIHPTSEGQRAMADAIREALAAHGIEL